MVIDYLIAAAIVLMTVVVTLVVASRAEYDVPVEPRLVGAGEEPELDA